MPLFELLGKRSCIVEGPALGNRRNSVNQIVIAGTMVGVCESLLYGYKAGLDLNRMLDSIRAAQPPVGRWTIWRREFCSAISTQDFSSSTSSRI